MCCVWRNYWEQTISFRFHTADILASNNSNQQEDDREASALRDEVGGS